MANRRVYEGFNDVELANWLHTDREKAEAHAHWYLLCSRGELTEPNPDEVGAWKAAQKFHQAMADYYAAHVEEMKGEQALREEEADAAMCKEAARNREL